MNFGTQSPEVSAAMLTVQFTKTCIDICNTCNGLALNENFRVRQFGAALDLLKKSEMLCENNDLGLAMTFNNMACYYKRLGKKRSALGYLEQALEIESKLNNPESKADTHLNICVVLSQLDRHETALEHARKAIILKQSTLLKVFLPKRDKNV